MGSANTTKEKIRLAAEELFARNGFHNTSLRAITAAAKVNLAAVNYHYGSKQSLLEAIFDFHLIPLNKRRCERLGEIEHQSRKTGRPPEIEAVLRAFIEPTLAFKADKKQRFYFVALVSQAIFAPDNILRKIFFARVEQVLALFRSLLSQALPQFSSLEINRLLTYILGAINSPTILRDSGENGQRTDPAADLDLLVNFILHGLGMKQ